MPKFHYKRISDPVHGTFGISELESRIISSKVFQRLHNIKQLGLAHLVFPGANYSRFSHSLGACHIAGRMIRAINLTPYGSFNEKEIQRYRLAGLLHDLGHYPFSHLTEKIVKDYYSSAILQQSDSVPVEPGIHKNTNETSTGPDDLGVGKPGYNHETLGRAIIKYDPELDSIFKDAPYLKENILDLYSRQDPELLTSIIDSDLDCDRLDYLVRTAHHSGLPYGNVDIEYIVSQTCVDSEGKLCLTRKALRAADHFLISRYFDYTQMTYHKTVAGLELVLQEVIRALLERGDLNLSREWLLDAIQNGSFAFVDDNLVFSKMKETLRRLTSSSRDQVLKKQIESIIYRRPPKVVWTMQQFTSRDDEASNHELYLELIRNKIPDLASRFSIDRRLWYLWEKKLPITAIGSKIAVAQLEKSGLDTFEKAERAVRILKPMSTGASAQSQPIFEFKHSLVKLLSNYEYSGIRLFVDIESSRGTAPFSRQEIMDRVLKDLPDLPDSMEF